MFKLLLFLILFLFSLQVIYAETEVCQVYIEENPQNEIYLLIVLNIIFGFSATILAYFYFKRFR
ncbi:MAG: hypothetical protein ACO2OV_01120 [Thermoproteota archaeon]